MKNSEMSAKLLAFTASPRTVGAISEAMSMRMTVSAMRNLVIPGYTVFENNDHQGRSVFMLQPRQKLDADAVRTWSYWREPKGKPLIWIQFDTAYCKSHDRIRLQPLSDVHYGHNRHNREKFRADLKRIAEEPDLFTILNGDMIENGIKSSHGTYDQILTPSEQIYGRNADEPGLIALLRPIRHKILWALPGNHEQRTEKLADQCPLRAACHALDVPYFKEPVFADLLAWGRVYNFYAQHGTSGGGTPGGRTNSSNRPTLFQNPMHFSIMGHVHEGKSNLTKRFSRRREYDDNGKRISITLEEFSQINVICPAYLKYFGTYGSVAALAPGSFGSVICEMFNSGVYRVVQERPTTVGIVKGLREVT